MLSVQLANISTSALVVLRAKVKQGALQKIFVVSILLHCSYLDSVMLSFNFNLCVLPFIGHGTGEDPSIEGKWTVPEAGGGRVKPIQQGSGGHLLGEDVKIKVQRG